MKLIKIKTMTRNTFISDLHLACAKDEKRPEFQCIYFLNGFAYTATPHMVIKQPLHLSQVYGIDFLEGKLIHAESFKAIRKMKSVIATEDGFECISKGGSNVFFQYSEGTHPNFDAVLQPMGAGMVADVCVNTTLLGILAKAMAGGAAVKMAFQGQGVPMLIEPIDSEYEGEVAVVMPITIS